MILYFNPDCSKCREARSLLDGEACEYTLRNYLADPPDEDELRALVALLGCKPSDLVRTSDPLYLSEFGSAVLPEETCIKLLADHPELIQRPILIDGKKAVIGRPPVKILELVHL